jgi:hypothetical protein
VLDHYGFCRKNIPLINRIPSELLKFERTFSLSSILEIAGLCFVAWQIRATRKNIFIEKKLETANDISGHISEIINILMKNNVVVSRGFISNDRCIASMVELIMLLDREKPDEQDLINCLNHYAMDDIPDINAWIKDIEECGNKVITNYKKS